ncbi:MAG: hypothetical protein WDO74_36585 [Pseudomonadota bacterium]
MTTLRTSSPTKISRDLRGARLIAAWLSHFDSREQNSMSTWMATNPKDGSSAGYVRHWYIDMGDCFGSEWNVDAISKRLGHAYLLDFGYLFEDFATFGAVERPWDRAQRTPGATNFGYFSARDFDPELWRGEYPNPAFGRMTERDGAWATRIIARFSAEDIRAAVSVGNFTNPAHTEFLVRVLLARQRRVLERYFSKLSPLADVQVSGRRVCATDLARSTGTFPSAAFSYHAELRRGTDDTVTVQAVAGAQGKTCVDLAEVSVGRSVPDDSPKRYLTLRVQNGIAPGPIVFHFYDLGAERGLRLVGIERPGS